MADAHLDGLLPLSALNEIEGMLSTNAAARAVLVETRSRLAGRIPLGGSQLERASVRSQFRRVCEEYVSSRDVTEVRRRLAELCVPADMHHELVRAGIELALERNDHVRELISQLVSTAHGDLIPPEEVVKGFEALLLRIDDLAIDNPKATEHLAAFLTRAVADDILPPAFVGSPPAEKLSTQKQLATLELARAPLSASHFGERRRHVWGAAADGSLGDLKKAVGALCDEYLVSGEIAEAVRCVKELDAPSYHHEVVKRLVGASVVDGGPRELDLAVDLTAKLAEADVLTTEQLSLGCTRLLDAVSGIACPWPSKNGMPSSLGPA